MSLTKNGGSEDVYIACSGAEVASGTNCTGNESVGIHFTVPTVGPYKACVSFSHIQTIDSSSDVIDTYFQIVETPTDAQTISQGGNSKIGHRIGMSGTPFPLSDTKAIQVCGIFYFASAGDKVLRLAYEQSINSTPTGSTIYGDADSSNGQRDIHWEVSRLR